MNDSLKISADGLAIEKRYEKGPPAISPNGFATKRYFCPAGKPTIGWGHVIKSKGDYMHTAVIDAVTAEKLLRLDNVDGENTIKRHVTVELTQYEFDALASLILNIGIGAFQASTLLKKINAGKKKSAADEFPRWNKYTDPSCGCLKVADGLIARREDERALWLGVKNV